MAQRGKSVVPVKVKLKLSWRLGMFNKKCDSIIVIKVACAIRVSIYALTAQATLITIIESHFLLNIYICLNMAYSDLACEKI